MLTTLLSFAFVLGVLIFVHELGHFATAKMVGIRVERFSLGFPPRAFGFQYGDTDYCVSWLPLGGYVKMAGMIDESLDETITGADWEFASKPVWQRIIVISAGSIMNFITAILIYAGIVYATGIGEPNGATVGELIEGKPAQAIGLQPGDVITKVDGKAIETWEDLTAIIHKRPNEELTIEWTRNGEHLNAIVVPELQETNKIGLIGIGPQIVKREVGLFEALSYGTAESYKFLKMTAGALGMIITGEESFRDSVGGPVIIAKLAGKSAEHGFQSLLMFTAFISLNLGFFNLLPFPVLDGGHLVILGIEGVMRKPLPTKAKIIVQKIGMAFLLALMVFILINDFTRLDRFDF